MILLSLILFAAVLLVIAVAAARDLSGFAEVDPESADADASSRIIRIAA